MVQLQASAERPQVQISTVNESSSSSVIDYGVVVAGNKSTQSVHLVNHGKASVPLVLALSLVCY